MTAIVVSQPTTSPDPFFKMPFGQSKGNNLASDSLLRKQHAGMPLATVDALEASGFFYRKKVLPILTLLWWGETERTKFPNHF